MWIGGQDLPSKKYPSRGNLEGTGEKRAQKVSSKEDAEMPKKTRDDVLGIQVKRLQRHNKVESLTTRGTGQREKSTRERERERVKLDM